jgi:hypothetical protein
MALVQRKETAETSGEASEGVKEEADGVKEAADGVKRSALEPLDEDDNRDGGGDEEDEFDDDNETPGSPNSGMFPFSKSSPNSPSHSGSRHLDTQTPIHPGTRSPTPRHPEPDTQTPGAFFSSLLSSHVSSLV